jgi:hypothetical protein
MLCIKLGFELKSYIPLNFRLSHLKTMLIFVLNLLTLLEWNTALYEFINE